MNTGVASSVAVTAATSVTGAQVMSASARSKAITSSAVAAVTSSQSSSNRHTHNGGVAAIELATTSAPAMIRSAAPKELDESTTTYTSNGNVYVKVVVVETKLVHGRDMKCRRGKRWVGEREVAC